MRRVIDIMIALMVIAVVAGGVYLYTHRASSERQVHAVQGALQQLQEQAAYHTAVQSAMAGQDVLLVHLHKQWFGEDVPLNSLLSDDRPWIDLAPPGDLGEHPPDPVATSSAQAGFWYNPTTGVFRARVMPATSEAQTLALYNEVNGTALPGFEVIPDMSRQPMAHTPGQIPSRQYASMANKTWSQPAKPKALETDLIEAQVNQQLEQRQAEQAHEVSPATSDASANTEEENPSPETGATLVEVLSEPIPRPTLKSK